MASPTAVASTSLRLLPSLTTWTPFCAVVLPMWTMLSPRSKQLRGCSCQGCKATNHTGTIRNLRTLACLRNLHQYAPELFGTLGNLPNPDTRPNFPEPSRIFRDLPEPTFRNLPEPTSETYASIHRNPPKFSEPSGTCLRNLHHLSSGSFRNLPPEPIHRNPPEPSGTCLRNLHQHTPEPSGTFQHLPRQPTPAYTGTLQNLLEPSGTGPHNRTYTLLHRNSPEPSGTCLRNLHQHTPELSGTFAGTFRNLPELASRSGTRLRNLHQHTPELSGTFRNPPAEPTAAHTEPSGTFRNLPPEPALATRTHTGAHLG